MRAGDAVQPSKEAAGMSRSADHAAEMDRRAPLAKIRGRLLS